MWCCGCVTSCSRFEVGLRFLFPDAVNYTVVNALMDLVWSRYVGASECHVPPSQGDMPMVIVSASLDGSYILPTILNTPSWGCVYSIKCPFMGLCLQY